ncbi:hypothetical protein BV898_05636 [Hypsibius exemplaris]|uniref:Sushi, von Willebrand factor type A, EGF and pentraxin domain-containing protein 1 n=1 Tax=Hypsibius exemplaris TaxID=2072580 RepID=A0A1W0WYR4_HYPEX|nr:hypothetical protein BV898_05636 [Hypsibius exemplaris]
MTQMTILFLLLFFGNLLAVSLAQGVPATIGGSAPAEPITRGCGYPGSYLNSKVLIQRTGISEDGATDSPAIPVGTVAVYSCEEPYITLGEPKRVCLPDFRWSGSMPFCGLNVAMHKPIVLPADRFAWLTNDGIISTRARDCYAHSSQAGATFTWKMDLTETTQVHSVRILALADFAWSANVTVQTVSRSGGLIDVFCGKIDYTGSDQTAAVSLPCRKIAPVRWVKIEFSLGTGSGRLRLCEVNVLAVDALSSDFCPQEASAKAVLHNSCLSFHSHGRATWGGALQTCRKLGGTLIQDITKEEQSYLQGKLQYLHRFQPTEAFYWIGLFRSVNFTTMEDHWMWTNGMTPAPSFWAPNQPDNVASKQFCTGLSGKSGWLWNDLNCESGQGFWICRTNFTSCPIPEQPANGLITALDRRLGGLATYRCEEGFELLTTQQPPPLGGAVASRSCQSSGTWSGLLPQCLPAAATVPPRSAPSGTTPSPSTEATTVTVRMPLTATPVVHLPATTPPVRVSPPTATPASGRHHVTDSETLGDTSTASLATIKSAMTSPSSSSTGTFSLGTINSAMTSSLSSNSSLGTVNSAMTSSMTSSASTASLAVIQSAMTSSASTPSLAVIQPAMTSSAASDTSSSSSSSSPGPGRVSIMVRSSGFTIGGNRPPVGPGRSTMTAAATVAGSEMRTAETTVLHTRSSPLSQGPTATTPNQANQGAFKSTETRLNITIGSLAGVPTTTPEYFAPAVTVRAVATAARLPAAAATAAKTPATSTTPTTPTTLTTRTAATPTTRSAVLTLGIGSLRCKQVPMLLNGHYTVDMLGPMLVARYSCNGGFNLVGLPFLTCTPDGSWRGMMPLCIPGYGSAPVLQRATTKVQPTWHVEKLTTKGTTKGTTTISPATSTPELKELSGVRSTQRLATTTEGEGARSLTVESNTVKRIEQPETTMTSPTSSITVAPSQRTFGTVPAAFEQATLSSSSTRAPAPPEVRTGSYPQQGCPPLPVVDFAEALMMPGRRVHFRCLPGYVMVGSNVTTCLVDGTWDSFPECLPVDCGLPEKYPHGMAVLVNGSSALGSLAAYTCSGQLVTHGIFYRICAETGRWEGPVPDCTVELPSMVPAESRQDVQSASTSSLMTIIMAVVGTVGALTIVIATVLSVRWLRKREPTRRRRSHRPCTPLERSQPACPNDGTALYGGGAIGIRWQSPFGTATLSAVHVEHPVGLRVRRRGELCHLGCIHADRQKTQRLHVMMMLIEIRAWCTVRCTVLCTVRCTAVHVLCNYHASSRGGL